MRSDRRKNGLFHKIVSNDYMGHSKWSMFDAAKDNLAIVQKLCLDRKLPVHQGCVNTICWDETGRLILSGSDDRRLCITDASTYQIHAEVNTAHRTNIFCAKFLPQTCAKKVMSCSADGVVIANDIERPDTSLYNQFKCHRKTVYELVTITNDPNICLSCSEDGTVRLFDLRTRSKCDRVNCEEDIIVRHRHPITSIAVNNLAPYQLAVGGFKGVHIYDRRMLGGTEGRKNGAEVSRFCLPGGGNQKITSLSYSPDGLSVLVSYSSDYVYIFDVMDDTGRNPEIFSKQLPCTSNGKKKNKPSLKRLRLRGDWSDTGPNSRPERERARSPDLAEANSPERDRVTQGENDAQRPTNRSNLISGLSDLLTRFLNRAEDDELEDSEVSQSSIQPSSSLASQVSSSTVNPTTPRAQESELPENFESDTSPSIILCPESTEQLLDSSSQNSPASDLPLVVKTPPSPSKSSTTPYQIPSIPELSISNNPSSSYSSPSISDQKDQAESCPSNLVHSVKEGCKVSLTHGESLRAKHDSDDESDDPDCRSKRPCPRHKYTGHRNARTMIKEACFWGNDYIMSGSDCGHIFIWDRYTHEVVNVIEADHHVVNCLQPHPFEPILASSGIDYDVKLWAPLRLEPFFDKEKVEELVRRNETMLEETRDVISVPCSFMLRFLMTLQRVRAQRRSGQSREDNEQEEEPSDPARNLVSLNVDSSDDSDDD